MKKLKKIAVILLCIILLIAAGLYVYLGLTLPKTEGILRVKHIGDEIQIKRNQWGVPFIEAKNVDDMFFAIGFCHASDRLFQMDLNRRQATGRLSEVFGRRALEMDKYRKDLLIEESIEKSMVNLDPTIKKKMQSYCNGVNFVMETRVLPPEFKLLRYTPEPWTVKDIFAIFKNMELILADSGSELTNAQLVRALGRENAEQFIYGTWGTTIINPGEYDRFYENKSLQTAFLHELELGEHRVGSNNWVISGKKSRTGFPILANDPHLSAVFPSYFYQVFARCPGIELSGNTLAGIPFVIIGRNEHIGWGFTNIGTDVIDYFILKINPQNKDQYEWDGKWTDFDILEKRIKVKGSEDVIHRVRVSRLGPVYEEEGQTAARHSIGEYPSTAVNAFDRMQSAKSAAEFIDGLKLFSSPAQNVVFADKQGNIGYYPTGLVPKRKKGNGELPLPALGSEDGWDGFYSEEEKPFLLNPAKGYIVTANNAVLPDRGVPVFAKRWYPSFRADRIDELLRSKSTLSIEDNTAVQTDSYVKGAEFLIRSIRDFIFESEGAKFVSARFKKWDFKADGGISPFLFYRFRFYLAQNIFNDNITEKKYNGLISTDWVYKIMDYPRENSETGAFSFWVDDIGTPEKEDFRTMVERSLNEAYDEYMAKSKDGNLDWRDIHTLEYRHPLGGIPVLGWFLNKGPFGMAGGRGCILTASFSRGREFRVSHLSTFRMVMDFSDFSNSLFVNTSGQSGHFMSKNYDDQIDLYVNLKYRKMEDFSSGLRVLKLQAGLRD